MRRALLSVAISIFALVPISVHAAPVAATPLQSICEVVIIQTPEGQVEGVLCYPQGGRM
jgi:hypothetical protein